MRAGALAAWSTWALSFRGKVTMRFLVHAFRASPRDFVDLVSTCGSFYTNSIKIRFALSAHHTDAQSAQARWIVRFDDLDRGQERIVGTDVRRVFGGLFDGFHFFLAAGVVEGTYDDGLSEDDVSG